MLTPNEQRVKHKTEYFSFDDKNRQNNNIYNEIEENNCK